MSDYFKAYITNLGKYNEGALVGEYLKFPTTTEEVQALLKRIGIDGVRYEEIFITDYDGDMPELYSGFGEYESIDELNYLAVLLSEMDQSDLEKFEAVLDTGEHSGSVKELINLTQNLDCFEFYSGITSEEELGRMYIQEFDAIPIPEHLIDYIDYEAYGRDVRINEGGSFSGNGYVFDNNSSFIEHYSDREDIPDEYRVFSMPELTIRERMAAYKEVSDKAAQHSKPVPEAGRDDR
ncbi:antirestriction protein ArdA [Ruminococcaceae bacterium AM07-15]|nr:antirestriction protein ArdA [Ruminococcaceae bacterium AM07-15]